jgi:hypothetical protein
VKEGLRKGGAGAAAAMKELAGFDELNPAVLPSQLVAFKCYYLGLDVRF